MTNKNIVHNSNIYKFQIAHGFENYDQLFRWSNSERAEFWQDAIDAVGIQFDKPYTQVLDVSHGIALPSWLVGANLNIVNSCFKSNPHKTAIIFQKHNGKIQNITYATLHKLVNRVSNSLIRLGLKPGNKIAIDMPMTIEAVAIYLGIIQAGFVAVGIAESFVATEVARRLQISDAKLLITQDIILRAGKKLPLYEKLMELNINKIVLPADEDLQVTLKATDLSWQQFLSNDVEFKAQPSAPHEAINILFSSGTTGEPKAIVWDHTSAIKAAVDGFFYQDIQESDVVAWSTSLGWMMGPWLIFATLVNQAAIGLFYDVPTSRQFTEFVSNARVTILGVVPSIVKAWRTQHAILGLDWSAIKLFTSTGETSNAADMEFLMQTAGGKPVIEYCGGTEISGAYITSTLLQENIPATFSTPALGLDVLLLDDDKQLVEIGEVAIVAPSIGLSRVLLNRDNYEVYYQGMPTSPTPNTLLRRHGDQMQRLPNNYYKSLGRADDAMNLGGIKISAAEIEACFINIPNLVEAVAVCKDSGDAPGQLIVFVVLENKCDLHILQQQMQQAIDTKLNPLFKIAAVRSIDSIPRTSSNKIMRRVLREQV